MSEYGFWNLAQKSPEHLALVELLLDKPNVILLDEPTNHLDVNSCEALETALAGYGGTIVCVSHDRYFLEKTVSRLLVIEPPDVRDFSGRFSEWAAKKARDAQPRKGRDQGRPREPENPAAPARKKPKADNPWLRPFGKLSIEELEKQITTTEVAIADAQQRFSDPALAKDVARSRQQKDQYEQLCRRLEELEHEYFTRSGE